MKRKEILEDILEQHKDNYTGLGEPQAWIDLGNGRSMEVVEEQNGLLESEYFFSCRLHCNEDEFDNNLYKSTCGVIESYATDGLDIEDLEWCVREILNCNNAL